MPPPFHQSVAYLLGLDEFNTGHECPSCGNQVVNQEDAVPRLQGRARDDQRVLARRVVAVVLLPSRNHGQNDRVSRSMLKHNAHAFHQQPRGEDAEGRTLL